MIVKKCTKRFALSKLLFSFLQMLRFDISEVQENQQTESLGKNN